jgi:predicted dehydrogenase
MATTSRRTFLRRSGIALGASFYISRRAFGENANDKLNIGFIGTAGQARFSLQNLVSENIVAVCDVDEMFLAKAAEDFPKAKKYQDFRRLLDHRNLDAVVIATPDHTHAVATIAALQSGYHVYCEKPLTHTVSECRAVQRAAEKAKKATQIGTQIHAGDNYRRVVELIQRDAIGKVNEVHVWVASSYGGKKRPTDTPPVPSTLNYDLWLGPVEYRPYHPEYLPFKWRDWWAFGGGSLADFGCHYMDLAHWALRLNAPISVEAEGPEIDPECPPTWLVVRYQYANPDGGAPLKLTWYHGGRKPEFLSPEIAEKWKSAVLFVGEKGEVISDYSKHLLLPQDKFVDFKRPERFIPKSIGHHKEWVKACKTGSPTTCNFAYSGTLTEAALLGNVAFRTGQRIEWDSQQLRATNTRKADEFVQHHYRHGWTL